MSTAVATVRVHPDKYEKDFDAFVAFLTQYIYKKAPTLSVKVASVPQTRSAKWKKTSASCGTFKGNIEFKKFSKHQQLYELQKKAGLIKSKKIPKSRRALEARVALLEAKTGNRIDESLFADEKPEANNRNNPALDRKGNGTR